jgi:N-methylhydantoinase A
MSYRLGIDIGGTFTDFALHDRLTGITRIHKCPTTPVNPAEAVKTGAQELLAQAGIEFASLEAVVHGTTLVTNAVIERRGAVTGMLVTAGFRDLLDIGKEQRYDLFDLRLTFPDPIVPRPLRQEIRERILFDGRVERALDASEVRAAVGDLVRHQKIESLAVCFLHSYAAPQHEAAVKALVTAEFPNLYLSVSSEVCPFMREYERWTTTALNAYSQPLVDRYLATLEREFAALGFSGPLHIMTSSGGTVFPDLARRFPVRLMESGPAAGILKCAQFAHGQPDAAKIIGFDMGGTTTKGALIRDGVPVRKYEIEIGRVHAFKKGSGWPVKVPAFDMIEFGAGGGGIAEIDGRGVIKVGPRSAGAAPGPACYGRGGKAATLTDANLLLGFLDRNFFLGGRMRLDPDLAKGAIQRSCAGPLGIDPLAAAWGIYETVNEDIARAFRVHAAEHGFDYRSSGMIAFGGGGPIHALRIARKLRVPSVTFPAGAGVMSAFGLLVGPLNHEIIRSDRMEWSALSAESLRAYFAPLLGEAAQPLLATGLSRAQIRFIRRVDMRYRGQGYEVEVALPDAPEAEIIRILPELFARQYERIFSLSFLDQPLEIVNWKVEAVGPQPDLGPSGLNPMPRIGKGSSARKGSRPAFFVERGGMIDCPVFDRYALSPDDRVEGPALVEENESTVVLGPGDRAIVDSALNLVTTVRQN